MKKTNRLFKNFAVSLISQLLILVLGLIVPRVVLVNYGSDINGLLNTVSTVFVYLTLLEVGISQATTNALYRPIKEGDKSEICLIASTSRKKYYKISFFYAVAVILLSIVLPLLFKTSIDYWTIFFLIILEGMTNVVSFLFINTLKCFLNAYGQSYINNSFDLITRILCYLIKISLASYGFNIVLIQLGYFLVSLIKLALYSIYFKRKYYWVVFNVKNQVGRMVLPQQKSFFAAEIASLIFQSTDLIVLSIFVSTSLSSVYSIYNLVFLSLSTLLNGVFVSMVYFLNHTYISNIEKYKKIHDLFNSLFIGSMTVFMCVSLFLITPFIQMYTNDINDINYINILYPPLFCLVQLISWCRYTQTNLMGISGNANKLAHISIVEALTNVSFSILLVFNFGIVGILFASILAMCIKVCYLNYFCERKILNRRTSKTIIIIAGNLAIFGLSCFIYFAFGYLEINDIFDFIRKGISITCLFFIIVLSFNVIINKDLFKLPSLLKHRKGNQQ